MHVCFQYYDGIIGLADVACKKDNGMILYKTCMPELVKGINVFEESDLIFTADGDGGFATDLAKSGKHVHLSKLLPSWGSTVHRSHDGKGTLQLCLVQLV